MATTLNPSVTDPRPPAAGHDDDPRALRVVAVLASALPAELGTPREPERYTVPVVFSRQVTPTERSRIEDPETARRVADASGAGPDLTLEVSDRRLLVHHTNLRMLKDGLATAIAQMLQQLGQDVRAEQDRATAAAELRESDERERADAVSREAAEITFALAVDRVERGLREVTA